MKPHFRTPYDENYNPKDHGSINEEPSLTHQSFKEECDINTLLSNMAANGLFPDDHQPLNYKDCVASVDYKTALDIIIQSEDAFYSLEANIRARFNNDPAQLLEFLEDKNNRVEAENLGIITPIKAEPKPPTVEGAVVPNPAT